MGALEARRIPAGVDRLNAVVATQSGGIQVRFTLRADERHRATVERVHRHYVSACPLHKTLPPGVVVDSQLVFEPL